MNKSFLKMQVLWLKRSLLKKNDPDFIVIGAQKSGTSSLHYYLDQHPELIGSYPKEVHFFDRDVHFGKKLAEYQSHFRGSHAKLHFEATPSYLYSPNTAEKIFTEYPEIKIIVVFRDPVERAYSAWNHYRQIFESEKHVLRFKNLPRREGNLLYEKFFKDRSVFPSFMECIEIEQELINERKGFEPALLRRGLYLQQLEKYWQFFNPSQTLILGFKDLVLNTETTLNKVGEFIGVPSIDFSTIDHEPRNVIDYPEPMSDSDRKYLEAFFSEPNRKFFDRVGPINW